MDTCILCKSNKKDDIQYGEFLKNKHFGVHTYCLYLSSNLSQNGADDEGFLGFLEADIKQEVQRISLLKCCYCHKKYANIGCCNMKCRRTFHFICGLEHSAENQFCHDYRSYCHSHAKKVKQRPSPKETCLICYDNLCSPEEKFNSVNMILTPCCRNGWFHKLCLQKFAKTAGYFFKCPLCNDSDVFREKLPARGIFIPNQDAAWELEPNAFAELLERPNECAAQECKNRKGRKASSDLNPFVMCSTCGSTAMHRQCLPNGGKRFHCADCTIALEEGDSGRESLNLQSQTADNEEEYIDVCHVSDKEDLDIVNRLIGSNRNKMDNKRDSGTHHHNDDEESTDEEMVLAAVRRQKRGNNRRLRSDSENSDLPQTSKSRRTLRIRSDTETSNDISDEEIKPRSKVNIRRLKTDSESSKHDSRSSDEEEIKLTQRKRKSTNVLKDSEDEEEAVGPAKHKRLEEKKDQMEDDNLEETLMSEESDEDDDPLENFTKIVEKQKNISCIALRTRRSLTQNKHQDSTNQQHMVTTTSNEKENKKNEVNLTNNQRFPNAKETKREKSKFVPLKDEENHKTNLDISCIAKRTRRRSLNCQSSNKTNSETIKQQSENPLNISCIAVRTRRKTICAASNYTPQSLYEMSQIYEKIHETDEELPTEPETEEESDEESQLHEVMVDTDMDNFIVDDGYEEKDSKFEISCIANRTRKRKSLRPDNKTLQSISECDSDCSSATNSSSSVNSNTHLLTANINIRKRCNSNSSQEYNTSPLFTNTSSRHDLKPKTISPSLLLDKLPQRNYAAYLPSKYSTKSSSASTDAIHHSRQHYHPPVSYHPHSNNRKRF
ncbi:reticulocyte binding protein 2 homolog b [Lucilia sericata]|uniref:reticulocyte binding protein 2 homolog b n=1 Tax=Lucilia sericata TaxID=13632 RepID=UPI0018A84713|nr:reticulocyte binding protein 2 homolog b [Lucilia sericata]